MVRAYLSTVLMAAGSGLLSASASLAQAPALRVEASDTPAGWSGFVHAEVTVGADAPGDVTVTFDAMGVSTNTFIRRMTPSGSPLGSGLDPCPADRRCFSADVWTDVRVTPGEYRIPITAIDSKGRRATAMASIRVRAPGDRDADGLPDAWEEGYRLSDLAAQGGDGPGGDPDGDGVSNLDEYRAGTNPRAKYVRYFAEASYGDEQPLTACFEWYPLAPVERYYYGGPVRLVAIGDNGRRYESILSVHDSPGGACPLGGGWLAIEGAFRPIADRIVAVTVESESPLAIERNTFSGPSARDPQLQLTNTSLGVQEPSRRWYFADGRTTDGLDLFLLLYNPRASPVTVDVGYVRAPDAALGREQLVLPPGVRTTIWVNRDHPYVVGQDVSMTIVGAEPILAERAYRFRSPGKTVPHDSISRGVSVPATQWYFPDVDARGAVQQSIVVQNTTDRETVLTFTCLFADREPARTQYVVLAGGRRAFEVSDLPVPHGAAFSVMVESDGAAIVAERAAGGMTNSGSWRRTAQGGRGPATEWLFTSPGQAYDTQTDLVIMNPTRQPARVRIAMRIRGWDAYETSEGMVDVPAMRTVRVPIGYYDPARTIPVLASGAVTLTSLAADGETPPGLVVERTTRWSADGVAGSRATSLIGNFRD